MRTRSDSRSDSVLVAALFSVALHALVFALAGGHPFTRVGESRAPKPEQTIVLVQVVPPRQDRDLPQPAVRHAPGPARQSLQTAAIQEPEPSSPTTSTAPRQAASMEAPPAPTAEEWALAAQYTPKNSKRYRYTWGQQVRSMMGTAFEGPDQGMVRFRVEIAPDGALTRLETLWSTSPVAEQRAREAIENLPALPPTPTGKPLIFEKTISFQPFASDGPPIYRDDCLPDPPSFRNPFAWDGKSPHVRAEPPPVEEADPQSLEECLRQRPQDSVEAESAHDQRLRDQWDPTTLKR